MYDFVDGVFVSCNRVKFWETSCIVGEVGRWKVSENLKVRVPGDPSAIIEPKILSVETLWDKGISRTPLEKFKREARLCQNLSRDLFFDIVV